MSIKDLLQAFATVFPAELPDKTMIATVMLVARYRRPALVWVGAALAFTVHVVVAVAAGSLLGLLPDVVVKLAVAALFLTGAVLLFRAARSAETEEVSDEQPVAATVAATVLGSFGLVVLAEWGDLTQLATASLAASSGEPWSVFVGAIVALSAVAAIAVVAGRTILRVLPVKVVRRVAACLFAALAVYTLVEVVRG